MIKLDQKQTSAVEMAAHEPISLITGGPGTGKTTCLQAIIKDIAQAKRSYTLCAPTGKAARRMSEQTGVEAKTIHRLLQYDGKVYHNTEIDTDALLVDESSMIDIHLMQRLLSSVDVARTTVTFIGDADQLPPVGQGCPFRDLIYAYEGRDKIPVIRLQRPYRQDEGSWIAHNAPRVLAGKSIDLNTAPDFEFYQLGVTEGHHIPGAVVDRVKDLGDPDDTQVLTPTKSSNYVGSTGLLNHTLQEAVNPGKNSAWRLGGAPVRVGSRVMHTRNNYELERFNGEVGRITKINKRALTVQYDDCKTIYGHKDSKDLQLAYASTIHKSQGSEFPNVVLVLHSKQPARLLTRQLFYTAMTRAKKKLYIVGDAVGINMAQHNVDDTRRCTLLVKRLEEATCAETTDRDA